MEGGAGAGVGIPCFGGPREVARGAALISGAIIWAVIRKPARGRFEHRIAAGLR